MSVCGLSRKIYLKMEPPGSTDRRSDEQRLLNGLSEKTGGRQIQLAQQARRELHSAFEEGHSSVTASLAWNGFFEEVVQIEAGDTSARHCGYAVDLGSTSVVLALLDLESGAVISEVSCRNRQIRFGEDILSRIFYGHESAEHLEEIRRDTVQTILDLMDMAEEETGIGPRDSISMVVSGNTTMIHFLLGLDAFCIFHEPYAPVTLDPGFVRGRDLGLPLKGYVYIVPGRANYMGGDITSGMIATGIWKRPELSVFFDIGTNGELAVGCSSFLLTGAGAAGPALEGGSVSTGMRAEEGAVDEVRIKDGEIRCHVIGGGRPKGICGSGIVDLLAELFMNGWVDMQGTLQTEKSPLIRTVTGTDGEAVCAVFYAEDLSFTQRDIHEFIRTKAAAVTMMEYILSDAGISMDDVNCFYMAGAFGAHVRVENAIRIGMYPDVDRTKIRPVGNTSLAGAQMILRDRSLLEDIRTVLGLMEYVQFGSVANFTDLMRAASALPHTDLSRYPSVAKELERRVHSAGTN